MSYTAPDFADDITAKLADEGYQVHARHENGEEAELTEGAIFWFTWTAPGADIEVGEDRATELGAWASALAHRLENSEIEVDTGGALPAADELIIEFKAIVDDQTCYDIMCTASEGGINYWADIVRRKRQKNESGNLPDIISFEAEIQDGPVSCDHPEIKAAEIGMFMIDAGMIRDGIRRLLAPGAQISPAIRNDVMMQACDPEHACDADSADAIVQFAVFGELVFS